MNEPVTSKLRTPLALESTGGKSLLFTLDDDGEVVVGIDDPRDDGYTDFILSVPDVQRLREWLGSPAETGCSECARLRARVAELEEFLRAEVDEHEERATR